MKRWVLREERFTNNRHLPTRDIWREVTPIYGLRIGVVELESVGCRLLHVELAVVKLLHASGKSQWNGDELRTPYCLPIRKPMRGYRYDHG